MWRSVALPGVPAQPILSSFRAAPAATFGLAAPSHTSTSLEHSWTERVREGDEKAFAALFRSHYPSLCSLIERRVGSSETAEDLVQDLFARVWERRATLDPEQSLTHYLFRAARNQAINHLKHRRVVRDSQDGIREVLYGSPPGPDEEHRDRVLAEMALEAIEQLPDRCREIFLLSRQGGMKYTEIASLLGLSVKTVETQMGRSLRALRLALLPQLTGEADGV